MNKYYSYSLFTDFIFANFSTHCNLFITPKSILRALSWSFVDRGGMGKVFPLTPKGRVPSQDRWCSAFLFQLFYCEQSHLHSLLSTRLFTFFCFLLVILLLKWPPGVVLRRRLVFLSARRLGCDLQRKYVLNKLCSGVS